MKAFAFFLANFFVLHFVQAQYSFELVLEENFDSQQLNRAIWDTKYTWGRTIANNYEIEYYTDSGNIEIVSGILKLIARKQSITAKVDSMLPDSFMYAGKLTNLSTWQYTSGMICSKQAYHYGKYEIRCRMPGGAGMWPAFWLFGGKGADEIDFFEFWGQRKRKLSTGLHSFDTISYRPSVKMHYFPFKNFSRKFHTITCYWYPQQVIWLIDGKEVFNFSTNYPEQYKIPMRLITNLAVHNSAETANMNKKKNRLPRAFEVDYIKVWKLIPQP